MLKVHQPKTEDQERSRRAVIYLSEPVPDGLDEPRDELSIDQQRVACRYAATALHAEVIGEFNDTRADLAERPGLDQAMRTVEAQRPDFLITSSLERLADDYHNVVLVAWHLGCIGTIPVPAEVGIESMPAKVRPS